MRKRITVSNRIVRVILVDYAFGYEFLLGIGEAVCHPNHSFNLEIGIKLATKRAYELQKL